MTARLSVPLLIALLTTFGCAAPGPETAPPETGSDVVAKMIAAHGGLEKWRSAPTVSFQDTFSYAGEAPPRTSRVVVDQQARRAHLDFPETGARISWDGEKVWSEKWQAPVPPRFLALLSYYFLNLPWLAADPGVRLSEPGRGKRWDMPTEYITVKMTFEPGVGDTPDDYYLLFIDPESYQLRASEYTVTYADILPPGVEELKDVIVYEDFTTVNGLVVPARAPIYEEDQSLVGTFEWREVSFSEPFDESRMEMPAGAVVDTSSPSPPAETPES
jgi:hypothetical protein